MNLAKKLLMTTGEAAGGNIPSGGYVDDVFSAYLYTGNGSNQTINNGIDLAGEGGLVWIKSRVSPNNYMLFDTNRGNHNYLNPNLTGAQNSGGSWSDLVVFNSASGFSLGQDAASGAVNRNGINYTSWAFRKAPKFFDMVTYAGNGVAGRRIAHSLGVQAGFVTVKATSAAGDWNSYHRSATGDLKLNTTDAQTASRAIITAADASTFTVSGAANTNGVTYVAYLFAHDPSAEGIIQCGSFTTDNSGNATVNLGWEPQYLLTKNVSDGADQWRIFDTYRGWTADGNAKILYPNGSSAEDNSTGRGGPQSTGFTFNVGASGTTYIYMTIRRPNKPPTSGTQVYNAIARTGTGTVATVTGVGFAPDLVSTTARSIDLITHFHSRLIGAGKTLQTSTAIAEGSYTNGVTAFTSDGITLGAEAGGQINTVLIPMIDHFFRRAPGFMDIVCWTGSDVAAPLNHGLTVKPELIISKSRSLVQPWYVNIPDVANTLLLDTNGAWSTTAARTATATTFVPVLINNSERFVAYLFATRAGVSKVGSYNGNGGTQTIPCGFTTGSRFILIKRIDNTGDWFVWDTARGITPTTDPHLSLNTTAAEVTTDDSIDQDASGFVVNQNAATNINALGGNYLFLAIA